MPDTLNIVRSIKQEDSLALHELIQKNSARLQDYFPNTLKNNETQDKSRAAVNNYIELAKQEELFVFVIEGNSENRIAGIIFIKEIKHDIGKAELAYFIDEAYQGMGIVSASLKFVIKFAFDDLKLNKLYCRIAPNNISSNRVAQKNGFILEGTLRNEFRIADNELVDLNYYGLLNDKKRN